jgi:hypothetical protein
MNNLISLINIPVPPMLEQVLGYAGESRYVASYWEPAGDEFAWNDGQCSTVGANWHAWLIYEQHPRVDPRLDTVAQPVNREVTCNLQRLYITAYPGSLQVALYFLTHCTQYGYIDDQENYTWAGLDDLYHRKRNLPTNSGGGDGLPRKRGKR